MSDPLTVVPVALAAVFASLTFLALKSFLALFIILNTPPPGTPSKQRTPVFDELMRLLDEDEKLVRAVTLPHCYSHEFSIDRLILPDGTNNVAIRSAQTASQNRRSPILDV